jgi:hypothetical protein
MELLGALAVVLVVAFLIAQSKGKSAKKDAPQAVRPPKPTKPVDGPKLVARRPPKAAAKRAEETGTLDYSSTVGPVMDDSGLPAWGTNNGGMSFMAADAVRRAHELAGPLPYIPPPQIRGRTHTKVVDVEGTQGRLAVGGDFGDVVAALPFGPVFVTVRLEANEATPYGLVAYVDGRQVGWMTSEWKASDPWVQFVSRLDEAGILPRFQGLHRLEKTDRGEEHRIHFDIPKKRLAPEIAARIIEEQSGPPPK